MNVLFSRFPGVAIRIQDRTQFLPRERSAMRDQYRPLRRPAEVAHQLARQAERKVEAADPRPRAREERLERGEVAEALDLLELQGVGLETARRVGDGLRLALGASEVDAVDPNTAISS